MKFKTNAKCGGCEAVIRSKLNEIISEKNWFLDLDSPDKTLTVNAGISPSMIIETVKSAGFQIEELK